MAESSAGCMVQATWWLLPRLLVVNCCRLGKVLKTKDGSEVQPGLYVCGWVKRGPSGIIGTSDMTTVTAWLYQQLLGV